MEVVLRPDIVAAYVLGKRERDIAVRTWELAPGEGGILRNCQCEKGDGCQADGMVLYASHDIENKMRAELIAFAEEYRLPPKKIHYNRLSPLSGEPIPAQYKLLGLWKDEEAITEARDTFARLYWE